MNKKFTRLLSAVLVLMLCMAMALPAMAANVKQDVNTTLTFDKNLILDENANVPGETFHFTLEGNSGTVDASNQKIEIHDGKDFLAGVSFTGTENGSSAADIQVAIAANAGTTNGRPNGIAAEGYKYAKKSFTVDFSGVTGYTEPGVYRYKLSETAGSTNGMNYSETIYYIDVYVEYTTDNSTQNEVLQIASIIVTKDVSPKVGETISDATTPSSKVDVVPGSGNSNDSRGDFDNEIATYDLEIDKTVTGNQGSHTDYFTFTVELSNLSAGKYKVTTTNAAGNPANANEIVVASGSTTTTKNFTLKHGDKLIIENLPYGAKYKITEAKQDGYEVSATAKDTQSNPQDVGASIAENIVTSPESGIIKDTVVSYTNTREGTIPTGILLTIAPFAALMLIGLVGAVVILKKKNAANK